MFSVFVAGEGRSARMGLPAEARGPARLPGGDSSLSHSPWLRGRCGWPLRRARSFPYRGAPASDTCRRGSRSSSRAQRRHRRRRLLLRRSTSPRSYASYRARNASPSARESSKVSATSLGHSRILDFACAQTRYTRAALLPREPGPRETIRNDADDTRIAWLGHFHSSTTIARSRLLRGKLSFSFSLSLFLYRSPPTRETLECVVPSRWLDLVVLFFFFQLCESEYCKGRVDKS